MINKSKILIIFFAVALIAIASYSFYKYEVVGDFKIKFNAPCDPSVEACLQEEGDCADSSVCTPNFYKTTEQRAGK